MTCLVSNSPLELFATRDKRFVHSQDSGESTEGEIGELLAVTGRQVSQVVAVQAELQGQFISAKASDINLLQKGQVPVG